jgi:L-malate glycosyltransferase
VKIAIISTVRGYSWAGSEEFWLALALRALASGHGVTAFLHEDISDPARLNILRQNGGNLRRWRVSRIPRSEPLRQRLRPNFPAGVLCKFDVILVSAGSIPSIGYVPGLATALKCQHIPFVLLCQFNSDHLSFNPRERSSMAELLFRAKNVVFVARSNLEAARRQFAWRSPDADVLLNQSTIQMEKPLPWPAQPSIRMACVARSELLWKGQDILIDLASRAPWKERAFTVSLFGRGPDDDHIRALIKHFGQQDRFALAGHQPNVESIWRDHHILVLPSRGEGTPLVILEAMMCGRPVITTNVGGNAEVVQDGVTGFIAEAATVRSFSAALERAWANRSRWSEMGAAAHERAMQIGKLDPTGSLLHVLEVAAHA